MDPQPPVIDFAESGREHVHRAIDAACREWGVFQLVGHGIDLRLFAALRRQMRALFGAPLEQRVAISRTAETPWGFYDRELTRHTRDWKQVYDFGPADGADMVPQWPAGLPAFDPIVRAFYEACDTLALRLLRVITRNLGMPSESLDRHFRPAHTSFLRLNYYPRCPSPQWHHGVHAHTDSGALTLLLQDRPGLEVVHGGGWVIVPPRADALVVNIGDVMQVWSNDRYRAPIHRVRGMTRQDRYSVAFFYNPDYAAVIAPETSDAPPRYRAFTWGEFRAGRAEGDFGDYGQEVQIADYRI